MLEWSAYLDFASAFAASGRQILLEAILAVEVALLLNEANVLQRTTAVAVHADEVIGAPDATQSRNEGSPAKGWQIGVLALGGRERQRAAGWAGAGAGC